MNDLVTGPYARLPPRWRGLTDEVVSDIGGAPASPALAGIDLMLRYGFDVGDRFPRAGGD